MIQAYMLPASLLQRIEETRRRYFEETLVPKAVTWNEDQTKFAPQLCIDGTTYSVPTLFDLRSMPPEATTISPLLSQLSPCGKFMYVIKTLPRGQILPLHQGRRTGEVCFTTNVRIPVLGEIVEGSKQVKVWMSLTPHEIISQRRGLRLSTGKVMVGGLGMGWFLQKVCAKPSVTEVILVEKEQGLVDWLLPVIKNKWPHIEAKLKLVMVDDAIEQIGRHGLETRYMLDIWESYGEAGHDENFQKTQSRMQHVWGWGDSDTNPLE